MAIFISTIRHKMNIATFSKILLMLISIVFFGCDHTNEQVSEKKTQPVAENDFTKINRQISENPGDASLYYKRAKLFEQKKDLQQAYTDITKAVNLDSGKFEYFMYLADISFKGLQIQKSIDAFGKAISIEPRNKDAHLKLSELYLYLKAYPQSISESNEALKIDKNSAKAYFIKGFAFKETGDTMKALSSFQTSVEIEPDYYDSYIQLGNIQAARKNSIAIQYYNNALRIQSSNTEAYYNRGLLYQNMGNLSKAIEDYKALLTIDPHYPEAHYNLGYIDLVYKKDYKSAINHFTDAIRYNDQYAEAYYNRGLAFEFSGNKQAAVKDYNEAIKIIPTFKLALARLKSL